MRAIVKIAVENTCLFKTAETTEKLTKQQAEHMQMYCDTIFSKGYYFWDLVCVKEQNSWQESTSISPQNRIMVQVVDIELTLVSAGGYIHICQERETDQGEDACIHRSKMCSRRGLAKIHS